MDKVNLEDLNKELREWLRSFNREIAPLATDESPEGLRAYDEQAADARENLSDIIFRHYEPEPERREICLACSQLCRPSGICPACYLKEAAQIVTDHLDQGHPLIKEHEEAEGLASALEQFRAFTEPKVGTPGPGSFGNAERSEIGWRALQRSGVDEPWLHEQALSDLVCNLRHFADREGVSWENVERRALGHYEAEVQCERCDGAEEPDDGSPYAPDVRRCDTAEGPKRLCAKCAAELAPELVETTQRGPSFK